MRQENSTLADGGNLYLIWTESKEEQTSVRYIIGMLGIPSLEIADKDEIKKRVVSHDGRFEAVPCLMGHKLAGQNKDMVIFESPKHLVYSRDNIWMAAIAVGIIKKAGV